MALDLLYHTYKKSLCALQTYSTHCQAKNVLKVSQNKVFFFICVKYSPDVSFTPSQLYTSNLPSDLAIGQQIHSKNLTKACLIDSMEVAQNFTFQGMYWIPTCTFNIIHLHLHIYTFYLCFSVSIWSKHFEKRCLFLAF